jgi:NADH-quinone oxidoreductase subunit L
MGGLAKYMKWTAATCWVGALALIGTPFFSGFYSKDAIIEAVGHSHRYGATYAYWCVVAGVFVTALYTFRMLFMTFHGPERWATANAHAKHEPVTESHDLETEVHAEPDGHHDHGGPPHETPWVVRGPLVALAIPSVVIGAMTVGSVLFGDFFGSSIHVVERNDVIGELAREQHPPIWLNFGLHAFASPVLYVAAAGVLTAWIFFLWKPSLADSAARALSPLRNLLVHKYFFDWINEHIIAAGSRLLGRGLWRVGDQGLIDGAMVNGTAASIGWFGSIVRQVQSGYLYSYAFWMIIGLAVLLGWFLFGV